MLLSDFVSRFADIFEDTDPSEITPETAFQTLDEWDSLAALSVIALAKTTFGVAVTGREIRGCQTVADLYELISGK